MTDAPVITVAIVDDHPMFREGLRFTLNQAAGVEVVAEAADGVEGVALARQLCPDVIMMDINMPGLDGLSATRQLVDAHVSSRVLMLTMYDDDLNVLAAMRAGASGYLIKGAGPDQVLSAVRAVADGHAVFGAGLASHVLRATDKAARTRRGSHTSGASSEGLDTFPQLSPREREVLTLLADGLTNQEIGQALFISAITVRNHVSSILAKLQVPNRQQAMLRARSNPDGG